MNYEILSIVNPGEIYYAEIVKSKEPDARIEWDFSNVIVKDNFSLSILVNGNDTFTTKELKGIYSLDKVNKVKVKVVLKNDGNIEFEGRYKLQYKYLGSAPFPVTVTKNLIFNK